MPRNGSGTFTLPAGNPVVNGSVASSSAFNATMTDLATALTNSVAKDGQTTPAANLPMGGFRHTNVSNASARNQYAAAGQVQDGAFLVLGGVSGTNTIVASATPAITALVTGQTFRFQSVGENTGGVTLAVDGLSAVSVMKYGAVALTTADIPSLGVAEVFYDGTHFQLLNPALPPPALQAEMEAGTETALRLMSPLRVKQALPAAATQNEMEAGTESGLRSMSPERVAQAIAVLGSKITQGTPVATTSGTAVDFTSIPAGVKRISVMFNGVSLNSAGDLLVQLGNSGGVETTGYSSGSSQSSGIVTTGFVMRLNNASRAAQGVMVIENYSSNTWVSYHLHFGAVSNVDFYGAGIKTLSDPLTTIRITNTATGSNSFDAGAVNISYE
jgi:hypothetical protein